MQMERIACYYEQDGTTTLYRYLFGSWEKETKFISRHMEDFARQFKTSMVFDCMVDRDGFSFVITNNDIVNSYPLREEERNAIIYGKEKKTSSYLLDKSDKHSNKTDQTNDNDLDYSNNTTHATTKVKRFLFKYTPKKIAEELKEFVLGQDELLNEVADFLYYHMMRLDNVDLPPRPMLISGPSGSGKTEVWRAVQKLYGRFFTIKIINGAKITQDGWKGDNKLLTFVTEELTKGGILVVDEFDKLATPSYSSKGDNVSYAIQSEFLKLLEGEETFFITKDRSKIEATSKQMGFVLIGAFESLTHPKNESKIGFGGVKEPAIKFNVPTDEDLIDFGVMPELIGRIAQKGSTKELQIDDYLMIVKGQHSRVSKLIETLKGYGIEVPDCNNDDQIVDLIKQSQTNRTGVRWVSAQLEQKILLHIRDTGLATYVKQKETDECEF